MIGIFKSFWFFGRPCLVGEEKKIRDTVALFVCL
jgi:hypothetical protein